MVSLNAIAIGMISLPPFIVNGLMIEARVPCCSKNEVVCLKSGVVRPGKQAGVNLPFVLVAFPFWVFVTGAAIKAGFKIALFIAAGDEVAVFELRFMKLLTLPYWNELSTSLSSSMLYKLVSTILFKLIDACRLDDGAWMFVIWVGGFVGIVEGVKFKSKSNNELAPFVVVSGFFSNVLAVKLGY